MAEEPKVVRPPEFKKVLEELQLVRLSKNLKMEIQGRRDLEEIYHQLLEDVAGLEKSIEAGLSEVERVNAEAARARKNEIMAHKENGVLQKRVLRTRIACYFSIVVVAILMIVSWEKLSGLFVALSSASF